MELTAKIFVAGHRGMVGSAIYRRLQKEGYTQLITRTSSVLDLRNQQAVADFFAAEKPEYVFLAAAKVGGIVANNTYRADFLYENLAIQNHVIHNAYLHGVKKLLFLGSSCIYPKLAPQPLKEEYLLTGLLEETNEPYAIAKIAGIELCDSYRDQYGCNFISAMPTNLYGTNDNYHPENSHVLPALIRRIVLGKKNNEPTVTIWGTGTPKREFLHVDDLGQAVLFALENKLDEHLYNVGTGVDLTIKDLAELIQSTVGHQGEIVWDSSKPDGTPKKLMDVSKMEKLGWKASISLQAGIESVYQIFKKEHSPE